MEKDVNGRVCTKCKLSCTKIYVLAQAAMTCEVLPVNEQKTRQNNSRD